MTRHILSVDQGTTSSRAIVFSENGKVVSQSQKEFTQFFPNDGWVEHDANEIWKTTYHVCGQALLKANLGPEKIASIGITNQRETTVIWDRETGEPIHKAIVWQDRRTASFCEELYGQGHGDMISDKTGLLLDAYFSASKITWLLDNVEGARDRAEKGELAFGTIDTWLLWKLTNGKSHKTDATNASRTMLFNIHSQEWDKDLLEVFRVPASLLPEVEDCAADFGDTEADLFGKSIPVGSMVGDQQAALVGQTCFEQGMLKSTYGTGCFLILNTGETPVASKNRLLTTVGYRLKGKVTYAIEGSIFIAGAAVQWLRDGLKLIESASETEEMMKEAGTDHGVYMVPAFTGLGAPYWNPEARGAVLGLTRDTTRNDMVAATLQSVAYQTKDLVLAMEKDAGSSIETLRVDGGMVVNNVLSQFLSDILDCQVDRPSVTETTAIGAAFLAGLQAGIYQDLDDVKSAWSLDRSFTPALEEATRTDLYEGWKKAVAKTMLDS